MEKKILIDWLTFTLGKNCFMRDFAGVGSYDDAPFNKLDALDSAVNALYFIDERILTNIIKFLGLPYGTQFVAGRPLYGYKVWYVLGGIRLAWGDISETIMVDLTGEGCRLMETLQPHLDWLELIKKVLHMRTHNFSRMDVACDTQGEGGLRMKSILKYSEAHKYVSRWTLEPLVKKCREETVVFGSPQSRTLLRIYNKTLERQKKVDPGTVVPENWVRCEFELRNQAVDSFIRDWVKLGDISQIYLGLMSNQLKFVSERNNRACRSKVVRWWKSFLDNATPIKLAYVGGLAYNLQSLSRYVVGQAGSSINTWLTVNDGDITTLVDLVSGRKLNDRQKALIQQLEMVEASKNADKQG